MPDAEARKAVRVGIAGLGRSGWKIHAATLRELSDLFQVTAVFDLEQDRRDEAVQTFGCRAHDSYEQLIHDPDVELVIVATPSHLHAPCTIQALEAGRHVVCEKPVATSLADADDMIRAAQQSHRILSIFQNRRFEALFNKVQQIIDAPGCPGISTAPVNRFGRRR